MTVSWLSAWFWPAVGVAFLLGVQATRWWMKRFSKAEESVNKEYFKGLNFLLNEEPDKAIEVFIKALEVDTETVELHLALGGLFRRKGQVDRATRIHQNLIARPSLTEEQRLQAIFELAQDYQKAGLLDRAEDLFNELKESVSYREQALKGLCDIYQQEKDWAAAIDVIRQQKRSDRPKFVDRVAHYWCELAELAISAQEFDSARKYLRNALSEKRTLARAVLLRGELHFQQGEYRRALSLWQSLSATSPVLASLAVKKAIIAFNEVDDQDGLKMYLLELSALPREVETFRDWFSALQNCVGEKAARAHLFERARSEGMTGPAADYLFELNSTRSASATAVECSTLERELLELNADLLNRAKQRRIEYTCQRCGFETRSHYWLCPNCGEWDSFST